MIDRLKENLKNIRERIAESAKRSGRDESAIELIAVTKYVDAEAARNLVAAGCNQLGESRPQVLWDKAKALSDVDVQWHMIGHLQRNKVRKSIEFAHLVHSADSLRLLTALDASAKDLDSPVNVLLEVNISNELAKHGFAPGELMSALEHATTLPNVNVRGLMGMAGLNGNDSDARREFSILRSLLEKHSDFKTDNIDLVELSMGMSGDFEIAIEEGATLVRIGSLLFEGLM